MANSTMIRLRSQQQGAIIPILAALMLGILTVMIMVGIDAVRVKQAKVELQRHLEQTCQATIDKTVLQAEMFSRFSTQVNLLLSEAHLRYSELRGANLIAPTMENSGLPDETGFAALVSTAACNLPGGGDCRLITDLGLSELSSRYPPDLWTSSYNAGNLAGCEFSATVKTFMPVDLSGTRSVDIFAKTVYWQPVWGRPSSSGNYLNNVLAGPGLSIVIATEMANQLPGWDGYNTDFLHTYSATQGFDSPVKHSWADPIVPADTAELLPILSCKGDANCINQLRLSCINPVTVVRNGLLSALAELASRHGQLRQRTEVLHVNPVNQGSSDRTPPALIASFGEDIAKRSFQIPFVFYGTGQIPCDSDGKCDPQNKGFINPFSSSGWYSADPIANLEDWRVYQAFLASQLRLCHHIYAVNSSLPIRYDNQALPSIINNNIVVDGTHSVKFEPVSPYHYDSRYPTEQEESNPVRWDQACPWVPTLGEPQPDGCDLMGEDLTVAEVLAVLGSTRSCPYPTASPASIGGNCSEGATLQPDLAAALDYLAGSQIIFKDIPAISDLSEANDPGIIMPAFQTPGLFPRSILTDSRKNDFLPVAQNDAGVIILVTHQPLTSESVGTINQIVLDLNAQAGSRPMTVIYIPTKKEDLSDIIVNDFLVAFNANLYQRDPLSNKFMVIGPWDILRDPLAVVGNCNIISPNGDQVESVDNSDCNLDQYWHDLLTDSDDGIVALAARLFYNRLLRLELKF